MSTASASNQNLTAAFNKVRLQRSYLFGVLIITALVAFEIFNYSTTDFALRDLLGDLRFAGLRWATILAIAFCGIDFAGIARLFTPQNSSDEPAEVWYLFGAWMLAATMNAMLTWWGVSIAILNHQTLGNAVVEQATLLKVVPIFVAIMVWLIRVLIIGTFSIAGERLFNQTSYTTVPARPSRSIASSQPLGTGRPATLIRPTPATPNPAAAFRPSPKSNAVAETTYSRPEPTYHSVALNASKTNGQSRR